MEKKMKYVYNMCNISEDSTVFFFLAKINHCLEFFTLEK